jgi:hypothetical protein
MAKAGARNGQQLPPPQPDVHQALEVTRELARTDGAIAPAHEARLQRLGTVLGIAPYSLKRA